MQQVYVPKRWYDAVRSAKKQINLKCLISRQMISFPSKASGISKIYIYDDNHLLQFSNVRCFRFDAYYPNTMLISPIQ